MSNSLTIVLQLCMHTRNALADDRQSNGVLLERGPCNGVLGLPTSVLTKFISGVGRLQGWLAKMWSSRCGIDCAALSGERCYWVRALRRNSAARQAAAWPLRPTQAACFFAGVYTPQRSRAKTSVVGPRCNGTSSERLESSSLSW